MSQEVQDFFAERKAVWLKNKMTANLDEDQQIQISTEADQKFSLAVWLPDAAKRAAQLNMVSHPSKFSHPSAKTSSVIMKADFAADGYLRSGNVEYALDVFGNAAALDVYKFLTLKMDDEQTVLTHLENDSDAVKTLFNIHTMPYSDLKQGFMKIKQSDVSNATDGRVKQVYFPVEQDYHLLSILTPSGLLTTLKKRVDAMRFSDQTKAAKDNSKKNEFDEHGYDDIFNLTVIGYGGTKPQNISVLNNQNAGRAYLLASTPPMLDKRNIRLPRTDFFKNCVWVNEFKVEFVALHRLAVHWKNNIDIREYRDKVLVNVIAEIMERGASIRKETTPEWTVSDHYKSLPLHQKIWLDNAREEQRDNHETWLDDLTKEMARWILQSYETCLASDAISFGDGELRHVRDVIELHIQRDKEWFR